MRILFALPGLHAVQRGAEVAFLAVATELARAGQSVTLIGGGPPLPDRPYRYIQSPRVARERLERFPSVPPVRSDTNWEDLTFLPGLLRRYRPSDYDLTVTCAYPFTNWALRRPARGGRPPHVYVTQNGDWPAYSDQREFRFFGCDGLVCINPDFFDRNRERWECALIPNGVDTIRFTPGQPERARFGFPEDRPLVLMVSAMDESKNIADGIRAVAQMDHAELVVAGDGPLRAELAALADQLMPGRYRALSVPSSDMPALYRSADVFLHLSRHESFGNIYVESMACGVPAVVWDLPRTRWIMGEDAYYVPDPGGDLVQCIEAALRRGNDCIRSRLARAATFDWSRIATDYLRFFEQIALRRTRSSRA